MPINIKAGQHTVYWGDSLLLGGAIHGVSYGQNPLDVWKGFATPGSEAKELFRPRGGITLQAQPTKDLSVAAQWFYNWQADRIPESGSYLTIQDPLNFGGDSFIFGPNPLAAANPAAPKYLRLWRGYDIKPPANSGSLGDWGLSARWSPEWLDGTLGAYYRNTTDVFPQAMATPGVIPAPAAACTPRGGTPLPGGTLCFVNPNATTIADLQKYGKLGLYNGAYGDNIHIYGLTLAKNIAGVSVGAEVSYRQNMPLVSDPVNVLPASFVPLVAGIDRHDGGAVVGHAGCAGRHVARRAQRRQHLPEDRAVRHRDAGGRADLDAVGEGHAERGGVQGPQQLHGDRQGVEEFRRARDQLHADLVPGVPGRRPAGADHVEPGHLRQLGGRVRRQRGRRQLERRHRRRHLPEVPHRPEVQRLLRRLFDQPDRRDPCRRRDGRAQRRERVAVRPRLGVAHVQDHILTRSTDMFRKSLMALAIASLAAGSALAAVSADEAKQLGTTLTAVGAEKAGNKDGTIPEYTGGIKPPAGFQAGTTVRPTRSRTRSRGSTITGKDAAAHADKLTEGTKELLKRYPTMRVDVYPTHRTVAVPQRILDNTMKNATGAKTVDGGVALENVHAGLSVPDSQDRLGSDLEPPAPLQRHRLRQSPVRELERRRGRRADARGGGRRELGVADLRPEEVGADQRQRSLLARQAATTSDRLGATAKRCCGSTPSIR